MNDNFYGVSLALYVQKELRVFVSFSFLLFGVNLDRLVSVLPTEKFF